jgi:hypothetical protein
MVTPTAYNVDHFLELSSESIATKSTYNVSLLTFFKPKVHKIMRRFQKLLTNLFLTLHGHNTHCQQWELSKFLMRYQQFASHAYCRTSFQDGVTAGEGFLCIRFEVSDLRLQCSMSFMHGLKKTYHTRIMQPSHTDSLWKLDACSRWWQCMLCPCRVGNKFFINFSNRTILLCMACII